MIAFVLTSKANWTSEPHLGSAMTTPAACWSDGDDTISIAIAGIYDSRADLPPAACPSLQQSTRTGCRGPHAKTLLPQPAVPRTLQPALVGRQQHPGHLANAGSGCYACFAAWATTGPSHAWPRSILWGPCQHAEPPSLPIICRHWHRYKRMCRGLTVVDGEGRLLACMMEVMQP